MVARFLHLKEGVCSTHESSNQRLETDALRAPLSRSHWAAKGETFIMWKWLKKMVATSRSSDRADSSSRRAIEPASDPVGPLPEAIKAAERPAWRPIVSEGEADQPLSRFGGNACLLEEVEWPLCGNCGKPLELFVQLASSELPPEAQSPFGEGILQMFYCISSDPLCEVEAEAWEPFAKSVVVRVVPAETPTSTVIRSKAFPVRRIIGWELTSDYPGWEEAREVGIELSDDEEDRVSELGFPLAGDKLLGWPAWVQGLEYPSCPRCGSSMRVVFQVDSEDNVPYMFGDVGCGHISQCRAHPEVVAFAWACS